MIIKYKIKQDILYFVVKLFGKYKILSYIWYRNNEIITKKTSYENFRN